MSNRCISLLCHQNTRMRAVERSELATTTNIACTSGTVSLAVTAPNTELDIGQRDSILELLESTNEKIDSLSSEINKISRRINNVETGVHLSNETNAYLKKAVNNIIDAQTTLNSATTSNMTNRNTISVRDYASLIEEDTTVSDINLSGKRYPKISELIYGYIRNPNFTSLDRIKVAENNERDEYNNALAMQLVNYLRIQKDAVEVPTSDLIRIIKNHFWNQVREFRSSPSKKTSWQSSSRRRSRKKVLYDRRVLTYQIYKTNIDTLMKIPDCGRVLLRTVMSDGESDEEGKLQVYRPS
ncbi:hypothetical protein PHYBLDRAFT_150116 [Phycomyces blakesleeanus NRRL 1555(-)]|uniref:Uncharacterized protein n=1 Tax=Phycomyces blakesleeanus (strain ATCC 8743b / DSM 1359 / FGSC 10004 / NBRC 33097 / NRRL 1555) TaxID=763407 RepID=A0A162N4S3_PHYB8|nr:hypothetical protein PHYBLDRAFT_150116 [Phycomyces blakesleeanus NRRL 1555(-)]OAD68528.1 hypothetical protein PHYBLDRAFT_150116 [Phycomyces blakesleeanus NRRL 1555(-)]|eukprot:XP_018286568.1 hypothetical protein PHYBLDRAFT_150116 [Phycomyces blakesleeanus NRRL 1555(-)]